MKRFFGGALGGDLFVCGSIFRELVISIAMQIEHFVSISYELHINELTYWYATYLFSILLYFSLFLRLFSFFCCFDWVKSSTFGQNYTAPQVFQFEVWTSNSSVSQRRTTLSSQQIE